jgi:hypothetical protein
MKTRKKTIDQTVIRSFLAHNVETILENISARRLDKKNESQDLFALGGEDLENTIRWKTDYQINPRIEVLQREKESLGVYMTGRPLDDFEPLLAEMRRIFRQESGLHLAIVEKVKKIFTKSQTMMFALQLTLIDREIEGVIFSRKAMLYSPILEEDRLYWVIGRIDGDENKVKGGQAEELEAADEEKKEKISEENTLSASSEDEDAAPEEPKVEKIEEYREKPKMIIDHIGSFDEGFIKFLTSGEKDYSDTLPENFPKDLNWAQMIQNSELITQALELLNQTETSSKTLGPSGNRNRQFNGDRSSYEAWKKRQEEMKGKNGAKTEENAQIVTSAAHRNNISTNISEVKKLVLTRNMGSRASLIKQNLRKEPFSGAIEVELYVEAPDGELKKAKGTYWITPNYLIS